MKIMRSKVVALVVAFMMVFSLIAMPVSAAETAEATKVVTNDDAANFLNEKGLLQGDDNGDLMLDSELTREQMMVIVSRLLGVEDEAKNYSTEEMTFQDVPATDAYAPYVAWAQANNITQGYSEEKFGFKEALTAWQTKAFFVRALGYVDTTDEEMEAKADELGLTTGSNAVSEEAIVRGDMALLMYNTINAKTAEGKVLGVEIGVLEPEVVAPKLEMTVAAATVKTIKATFNTAVDTTKATFAVVKETVKVNVSNVAWNEAKTEATLTMAANLTEGDYKVTISGVEIAVAEKVVTVKDEEIGKIEFLSDKLILNDDEALADEAYTYVKIYNQYGQDVTEDECGNVTITAKYGTAASDIDDEGKVTVVLDAAGRYEVGDKITVTALNDDSGAFANAVLTVAEKASANTAEEIKLYNDDEEEVFQVGDTDFELVFKVKDQYGNDMHAEGAITAANIVSQFVVSSSNNSILTLGAVTESKIDDVKYFRIALTSTKEGTAVVRFISKVTGKSTTFDVKVNEKTKLDKITLGSPERAVEGEEILFPVTAVDQEGKEMTDISDLNSTEFGATFTLTGAGINANANASVVKFRKEAGKVVLAIPEGKIALTTANIHTNDKLTDSETLYVNVYTATNNTVQKSVKVYETAVPVVVGKVNDLATGVLDEENLTIEVSDDEKDNNVVVYDQYDRVYENSDLIADGYLLKFSVEDTNNVNFAAATSATVSALGDVVLTGTEKGSDTVKVAIYADAVALGGDNDDVADAAELIADSELEFTVNVVELKDIKTFEVKDLDLQYAVDTVYVYDTAEAATPGTGNAAVAAMLTKYQQTVEVNGVLSNGTKVEIPAEYFSVVASIPNSNSSKPGLNVTTSGIVKADEEKVYFESNKDVTTGKITVLVASAESGAVEVVKTITVSKAVPVAATLELTDDGDSANAELNGNVITLKTAVVNNADDLYAFIKAEDQYGIENTVTPTRVIFSNISEDDDATHALTLDNTTGAITNYDEDDTFTVTFIYSNGKSISVDVISGYDRP